MSLREKLIRNLHELPLEVLERLPLYRSRSAGVSEGTAAQQLGCAYDIVPPGKRSCPYHFHWAQEELFVILEGEGTLRVAGEWLALRAGDTVFIPPGREYPHQIVNTSDRPLKYLSIGTRERPEIVVYPDSGKYLAYGDDGSAQGFGAIARERDALDYWDGEP